MAAKADGHQAGGGQRAWRIGTRIAVDPITRIEGQLRIEVEVANGVVADAWAASPTQSARALLPVPDGGLWIGHALMPPAGPARLTSTSPREARPFAASSSPWPRSRRRLVFVLRDRESNALTRAIRRHVTLPHARDSGVRP